MFNVAGLARGYSLSAAEVERIPQEILSELDDYNELILVDPFQNGSEYILSYHRFDEIYPSQSYAFEEEELIADPDEYRYVKNVFNRYFPERSEELPKLHLYSRVNG